MLFSSRPVRLGVFGLLLAGLVALVAAALGAWRTDEISNGAAARVPTISVNVRSEPRQREEDATPVGRLVSASSHADAETVRALLAQGASPNTQDINGELPLHRAAGAGSLEVVELLLDAGADVDTACGLGWFPLAHAADSGSPEVTARLLEAGASPRDSTSGESPIFQVVYGAMSSRHGLSDATSATEEQRVEVLQTLLEAGASTSGMDVLLFHAIFMTQSADILSVLLGHGARLDLASREGRALLNLPGALGERLREAHENSEAASTP